MKEKDFARAQPYLFGQDFGQKAKEKLDAADALRKVVYQQPPKGKANFQGGYPCNKQNGAEGVAATTTTALENSRRGTQAPQLQQGSLQVEKKEGEQRPVINLKGLNNFVKMEHFKMEGLHLLLDIIQLADWMVKLDLNLQVPIHQEHQSLLQFQWQGKT